MPLGGQSGCGGIRPLAPFSLLSSVIMPNPLKDAQHKVISHPLSQMVFKHLLSAFLLGCNWLNIAFSKILRQLTEGGDLF